jgi:hypothetical protein
MHSNEKLESTLRFSQRDRLNCSDRKHIRKTISVCPKKINASHLIGAKHWYRGASD